MQLKRYTLSINSFFFMLYLGYGAYFPMIGVYLKQQQFSGWEMGVMMSISPLLMMVIQPIWGLINDYYQKPHIILILTSIVTCGILLLFPFFRDFHSMLLLFILLALFQSAINPLSDSLVVSYADKTGKTYGDFRLWGAVSFALSAALLGWIGEQTSLVAIFYIFAAAVGITAIVSWFLPRTSLPAKQHKRIKKDLSVLFRLPTYLVFLFATFCVLGSMLANNNFFGIFYQFIGGTIAGVGLCFLIGAGSEAPFMKVASKWIQKYGYLMILVSSAIFSAIQFFSYAVAPPVAWVPWITVLQGFSIGLFIPASVQMAGQLAPESVRTTAIAVYNAIAYGIGNWFFIFVGGLLLDYFPVTAVYVFFTLFTLLGVVLLIVLYAKLNKQSVVIK